VILIGGAATTIDALWYASRLLDRGGAARALVLAVETFAECEDLYARTRWMAARPLVEAAGCALLVPGKTALGVRERGAPSTWEAVARRRAGETFACEPLIALALAHAAGDGPAGLTGAWRGRRAELEAVGARPTPGRGPRPARG
jgi:hypothetical protein